MYRNPNRGRTGGKQRLSEELNFRELRIVSSTNAATHKNEAPRSARFDQVSETDPTTQLVEKSQQGDPQAFNQLAALHFDKVFGQAMRMTKSEHDAKEVAQLTWIKVWKKIGTFRGESAFSSWLFRITTFTALDFIRKRNSHRETLSEPELLDFAAQSDTTSEIAAPEQIRTIERQELLQQIETAMDSLPEKLRTTLKLRELEGLSYEEIAAQLHCKTGTVMSRLFNARKTIQKQLANLFS